MTRKRKPTEAVCLRLPDGGVTLVDADIAEALRGRRLFCHPKGYVCLNAKGRLRYLHQFVAPAPAGKEIDHISGDRRDNRRANLRHLTHRENLWCSRRRPGRSGYRGVEADPAGRHHYVRVRWCDRRYSAGSYASALLAAFARDDLARRVTGLDEGLNFPGRVERAALRRFLEALGQRLFAVVFVRRRDGAVRRMVCRAGVRGEPSGRGLAFDPAGRDLYPVFDLRKRAYRFIPLENVLCLTCNRTRYRITA